MAVRRSSQTADSLKSKGFRLREGDHHWFVLYDNDKATAVRTKVSHGTKDYDDGLLSMVQKQLGLPRKKDLLDLVDCSLTGHDYVGLLKRNGRL